MQFPKEMYDKVIQTRVERDVKASEEFTERRFLPLGRIAWLEGGLSHEDCQGSGVIGQSGRDVRHPALHGCQPVHTKGAATFPQPQAQEPSSGGRKS